MFDSAIALDILDQLREACDRILARSRGISIPDDFLKDEETITRLDAIGMMLIAIGENLKRLEKHLPAEYFSAYPNIDWKGAKGMRDFLSHGYWELQVEIVFNVCRERIPELRAAVLDMIAKVESTGSAS